MPVQPLTIFTVPRLVQAPLLHPLALSAHLAKLLRVVKLESWAVLPRSPAPQLLSAATTVPRHSLPIAGTLARRDTAVKVSRSLDRACFVPLSLQAEEVASQWSVERFREHQTSLTCISIGNSRACSLHGSTLRYTPCTEFPTNCTDEMSERKKT